MSNERKITLAIVGIVMLLAILCMISPGFRAEINRIKFDVQKADDATNYDTRKIVEDTCRSMIASYDADVLIWEQYKDSDGEQRAWADQARMRANKTASTYNSYILQNSFVWADNVPKDIRNKLPIVEE